jgi:hypothetical protein
MLLIGAAGLLSATAAAAQTPTDMPAGPPGEVVQAPPSRCSEAPPAPSVPDGATVNNAAWNAAVTAYEAWRVATQAALDCRANEAREAQATVRARVEEYNTMNAAARAVGEAMTAEQAEFNARPPRSRR